MCGNAQARIPPPIRHATRPMTWQKWSAVLVRRIERSRRYAVDPPGLRTLCAYRNDGLKHLFLRLS
jgi:hypothetical protein